MQFQLQQGFRNGRDASNSRDATVRSLEMQQLRQQLVRQQE